MSPLKHKARPQILIGFQLSSESSVSSPHSNPGTIKLQREAQKCRLDSEWLLNALRQNHREKSQPERDLRRFELRLCLWETHAKHWEQEWEQSTCRGIHQFCSDWQHLQTQGHKASWKRTEHFCGEWSLIAPPASMSECFRFHGNQKKDRAVQGWCHKSQELPSPLREELWGSSEIFVQPLGKDVSALLQSMK